MKFTLVLGLLSLVSGFSGLVRAESLDQCQELKDYLNGKIREYEYSCENNEEGKIKKLDITDFQMTEEDFEKVQSYDTITDLTYSFYYYGRITFAENLVTDINSLTNLKNLKNLEKLTIDYTVYDNPCTTRCLVYFLGTVKSDTFKDLKNLKELNVFGINLSQDNIDEISALNNLETLKLDYCSFENIKDFSPLSHLEKVNYLSATEGLNGFGGFESDKVPSELINQFKNIKRLEVDRCTGIDYSQHPDIEILSIYKEDDTSFLKNYKNLKQLSSLPSNDLSVLEYVYSLESLEISYEPSSYGFASFPYQDSIFKFSDNSHISSLQLFGIRLTNETVAEILKLKNLSYIAMVNCDLSSVSEEYIIQLEEFKNRCPFKSSYGMNNFENSYNRLEDIDNKDCDHFTTLIYDENPEETEDVDYEDPEETEVIYATENGEPEETEDVDYEDPEPTEVETDAYIEVDEQEPTEVSEPVVLVPEQKFIKNTDEEDKSKAESSPSSHRRKCYVKNKY